MLVTIHAHLPADDAIYGRFTRAAPYLQLLAYAADPQAVRDVQEASCAAAARLVGQVDPFEEGEWHASTPAAPAWFAIDAEGAYEYLMPGCRLKILGDAGEAFIECE